MDALTTLASMIDMPEGLSLLPIHVEQRDKTIHCLEILFQQESNTDPDLINVWIARSLEGLAEPMLKGTK